EALAQLQLPETIGALQGYPLFPSLIDACFQLMAAALLGRDPTASAGATTLPFALESLYVYALTNHQDLWCHVSQTGELKWDLILFTTAGAVVAQMRGFQLRAVPLAAIHGQRARRAPGTDWLYINQWVLSPRPAATEQATPPVIWLLFGAQNGVAGALATGLAAAGTPTMLVTAGAPASLTPLAEFANLQHATLDAMTPASVQQLLVDLPVQCRGPQAKIGVVYLWESVEARPGEEIPEQTLRQCGELLHLVQAFIASALAANLWLVTQNCQLLDGGQPLTQALPQAAAETAGQHAVAGALWGLGRTIALEAPALGCICIDLPDQAPAANANILQQELLVQPHSHNEPRAVEVAYRGDRRYMARLTRWQAATNEAKPLALTEDATYLITGGVGALGLQVAQQLAEAGAKYLVLTSRQGVTTEAARATLAQLKERGVTIQVVKADIGEFADVQRLLTSCETLAPLRGVIHAAGLLDDGVLSEQSLARFAKVLWPKVQGVWHLHRLTQAHPLDFFVCFSSAAALLGSPGQSNYAAANAFLDTLMQQRRQQGQPGLSINWGPWAEIGMAAHLKDQLARQGTAMIAPQQGRELFQYLLNQNVAQIGVLPLQRSQATATTPEKPAGMRHQLANLSIGEQRKYLDEYLRGEVAAMLGLSQQTPIDARARLFDFGIDSLMAVQLKNRLEAGLGCTLRSTLLFDYPTLEVLTPYLLHEVLAFAPEKPDLKESPSKEFTSADEQPMRTNLDELSEEQVATMLMAKLEKLGF
ncbi:MAG: type I polyketide synthase, partial [Chloroflexi bacterium]|nr:type I polyketide synthase [Chloroflexota bacterium]